MQNDGLQNDPARRVFHAGRFSPANHNVRRHEGVADKRYKLIRFYGPDVPDGEAWEFYDLEADPAEMNNTVGNPENAAQIAILKKEFDRLKEKFQVPDTARSGN